MKRIALFLFAALVCGSAMAQNPHSDKKDNKGNKHLSMQRFGFLNLTADQKAKMQSINDSYKQKLQAADNGDDQKSNRKALIQERNNQMLSVLTTEQKQQLNEKKAQSKGKKKWNKKENHLDDITKNLNLNSDQSAKVANLNAQLKTKVDAINNDNSLTSDQKKMQVKSLFRQHRQDMSGILTKEQKATLKSSKKPVGQS